MRIQNYVSYIYIIATSGVAALKGYILHADFVFKSLNNTKWLILMILRWVKYNYNNNNSY